MNRQEKNRSKVIKNEIHNLPEFKGWREGFNSGLALGLSIASLIVAIIARLL